MSYSEELVMSKDKYPSIFSRLMEATVFSFLETCFVAREGVKIGEYRSPIPRHQPGAYSVM